LFRFWLLFAVPWVAGWLIAAAHEATSAKRFEFTNTKGERFEIVAESEFYAAYLAERGLRQRRIDIAFPYLVGAVVPPAILFAVGAGLLWALRGFKGS
jgi:hypothetical protein